MNSLPIAAGFDLIVSLALAWLSVAALHVRPAWTAARFPRPHYLVKAHIDYLLMSLLLYVFFLLAVPLPAWTVACMVLGSIANPLLFVVMAAVPQPDTRPGAPIGIASLVSFAVTTAGFGGAAVLVALAHR